ncbi:hypothetical protein CAMSH0001_2008 [Campylobacter showae RM3277]|uniref:Uncharacterized protein n=1 Tax=Campylobacter showae RM3277 TaxID=553219 RepID=C6REB6_9BACT|nr:hypothetical protein CAMSH0001_2008 [Campylobacter showae RM3277]
MKSNLQILPTETRILKISKFEKLTFCKTEFLGEEEVLLTVCLQLQTK